METPLSKRLQHFIPFDEWSEDIIEELTPHFREHTLPREKFCLKRGQSEREMPLPAQRRYRPRRR